MGQQEEDEEAQESEDGDQVDGLVRRRGPGHRLRRLLVRRLSLLVAGHAQAEGPPGWRPQGEALHCGGGGRGFLFSVGGDAGRERGGGF